jgi:hypothetical protein
MGLNLYNILRCETELNMSDESKSEAMRDKQYWKSHVDKAEAFGGSNQEYCRLEGLTPSTFASYKKRFGLTKETPRHRLSGFSEVVQVDSVQGNHAKGTAFESKAKTPSLPDPKWLAELILGLNPRA